MPALQGCNPGALVMKEFSVPSPRHSRIGSAVYTPMYFAGKKKEVGHASLITCTMSTSTINVSLGSRYVSTQDRFQEEKALPPAERTSIGLSNTDENWSFARWDDAIEKLIPFWTNTGPHPSLESVHQSLALLKRLVLVYERDISTARKEGKKPRSSLHPKLMERIATNWEKYWSMHGTSLSSQQRPELQSLTPEKVLPVLEDCSDRVPDMEPSIRVYNCIMSAIMNESSSNAHNHVGANSKWIHTDMPKKALERIETVYGHVKKRALTPNSRTYEILIHAFVQAGEIEQTLCIMDEIVMRATQRHNNKDSVRFGPSLFERALVGCVAAQSDKSGIWAHQVLDRTHLLGRAGVLSFNPIVLFNCLLNAWAKSGRRQAGERAGEIMARLNENRHLRADTVTYGAAIHCYAKVGNCEEALKLLIEAIDEFRKGKNKTILRPNVIIFNSVLDSYAKAGRVDSGELAEQLLETMWDLFDNHGLVGARPDIMSYSSVIAAWATSRRADSGERASRVFEDLLEKSKMYKDLSPDLIAYATLANVWAQAGNVSKVTEIVDFLCEQYESGESRLKPDVTLFNTLLSCLAKEKAERSVSDAELVLGRIRKLGVKPDIRTYTHVIDAWAKSGSVQAGTQGERLLEEMKALSRDDPSVRPNVVTYSAVINCWTRSGSPEAIDHVERLVEEMKALSKEDPSVTPNRLTFNSVMNTWIRHGQVQKVEELLKEMIDSTSMHLRPDVVTFSILLNGLAGTHDGKAGERADAYLESMKKLDRKGFRDVQPNHVVYKMALKCWKYSLGHPRREERMKEYQLLSQSGESGPRRRATQKIGVERFQQLQSHTTIERG